MPLVMSMGSITPLTNSLDDMLKQIAAMPPEMYQQLDDWQTQDVKFRRAYTNVVDEHTVETIIWPRGRKRRKGYQGRGFRGRKARLRRKPVKEKRKYVKRKIRKAKLIGSRRPLLRPFLYDMLVDRMVKNVLDPVQWH